MWKCYSCESEFPTPYYKVYHEDMDGEGHFEKHTMRFCPVCGGEDIFELDEEDEEEDV